jgi:hypothetical protein
MDWGEGGSGVTAMCDMSRFLVTPRNSKGRLILRIDKFVKGISDRCEMDVDLNVVKEAIYWRGLFINRYSGIEFATAELVSRAWLHEIYRDLGPPPFGPTKKLARLRRVIEASGPVASYRDEIEPYLAKFSEHEEHRHFMVHGLMVPRSGKDILFKMYDHREEFIASELFSLN